MTMILLRPGMSSGCTKRAFSIEGMTHAKTWRQNCVQARAGQRPRMPGERGRQGVGQDAAGKAGRARPWPMEGLSYLLLLVPPHQRTSKGQHEADPVRL